VFNKNIKVSPCRKGRP